MAGRQLSYNFPKIRFCKRGHAIIGDNITFLFNEGKRWIGCRTCNRARATRSLKSRMPTEAKARQVYSELLDGKTIHQIVESRHNRIIRMELLTNLFRKFPKVEKQFRSISTKNGAAHREALKLARPIIVAPSIIRATDDIVEEIEAVVPGHLPPDHRADVIQNIWLAVLEGRLKRSEIAERAREYINAEYRTNHNAWGLRSLDVPIWVDGKTTLLDTLTRGLWD
jgi:hypothetical protein